MAKRGPKKGHGGRPKTRTPESIRNYDRRWRLNKKYGIDISDFTKLLEEQAGLCAVCQRPFDAFPNVDHDHKTGEIRGLLCRHCNWGLGQFDDSPTVLASAIKYLTGGHP